MSGQRHDGIPCHSSYACIHVPAVPGKTMVGMFQLSLGRLWQACSSCPWADYGRHVPAVPGQTIAGMFQLSLGRLWLACSSYPWADYVGHVYLFIIIIFFFCINIKNIPFGNQSKKSILFLVSQSPPESILVFTSTLSTI